MPSIRHPTLTAPHLIPTAENFGLLPKAFAPPASTSAEPPSDIVHVSFRPPQTGANGRRIERFNDFRDDALYTHCAQQIADRMDELSQFASAQCGRQGPGVTQSLQAFKHKLLENALPYLGDALPVIHGPGKRGLDEFCELMRQPTIDASACRVTLQEFASKLDRCGPYIGTSMVRLPLALRLAQGGLHARHAQALEHVTEQTLVSLARAPRPNGSLPAAGLEPHVVHQLRRELGLPGGEIEDRFAHPGLVSSRLIAQGRERLRQELHPSTMAGRLAIDALDELKAGLRNELGADLSMVDPMDAHALPFQRALDALNERYGGIRARSLVQISDEDFTTGRITDDPSLLALDLREQMTRLGLAPPARQEPIASWAEADGHTDLCHVEDRIFFHSHRSRGRPDPELSSLSLAGLARVPDRPRHLQHPEPWRASLAESVVESMPAQALSRLPLKWLLTEPLILRFLDRLPPATREQWLAREDLPANVRACATRWRALERERQEGEWISTFKVALRDNDPIRLSEVTQQLLRNCPKHLAALLESGILDKPLSRGESVSAEVLLGALHMLAQDGILERDSYKRILRRALTDEALTHEPTRTSWLHAVKAAEKDRLLSAEDAPDPILRPGRYGVPSSHWIRSPLPSGALRGWASLVSKAASLGILERGRVLREFWAAKPHETRGDILSNEPWRLAELMTGWLEAARDGTLNGAALMDLMTSGGAMDDLLLRAPRDKTLAAFMDVAIVATREKLLSPKQFLQLVAPGDPARLPATWAAVGQLGHGENAAFYLRKLVVAAVTGVLPVETFTAMLTGKDKHQRRAIAGAGKGATTLLVETIDDLRVNQLLTPAQARRLHEQILKAVRLR